ncbi:fatty acyl-CoA elongase, putative [Ixodes scapularis]|uniref:Elongation of very long chain fatty acids protein n=1 Tax=Ixodes scapularis TaxID=6945 RepID=B7QN79_IXOSC|nr:fatty acyl-CoA elongase, putative [Ixodes scapularis]|eukprot:XP_002400759.1 fatty acyl-CoA elongase, putative [Ixodes scapularis]
MIASLNPITLSNKIQQMGDPRTRDYPVVMSPLFVFPMILSYLYFVRVAGPRWMKNREPFKIVNIIRLYNLIMVYLNAKFLVALLGLTYLPGGRYSLWCQGITGYMDDDFERFYKFGWFFVSVRYADFLDTVFFVLRKKFTQITHLHVIHHTIVAATLYV